MSESRDDSVVVPDVADFYRFVRSDDVEPFQLIRGFVADLYNEGPEDIGWIHFSIRWSLIWAFTTGGTVLVAKKIVDLRRQLKDSTEIE